MQEQKYIVKIMIYILQILVKKSLSPYDDKKWITFDDGEFTCYSYGHYKIGLDDMMDCTE